MFARSERFTRHYLPPDASDIKSIVRRGWEEYPQIVRDRSKIVLFKHFSLPPEPCDHP